MNAAGEWTYTLDNGNAAVDALNALDTLSDSFTVYTEDGTAKTVDITINGANDAPVAGDQTFTIGQNGTLDRVALTQSDVDAGDQLSDVLTIIDPKPKSPPKDGGDAEFFIDENETRTTFQPSRGSGLLTNHDDGTFSFDTEGDYEFLGEGETFDVDFTYTVKDQAGESDTASVTITIEGENDAPITSGSLWTIAEDFTFSTGGVTGYDPDDNDPVTFVVVSGPAHAALFELDPVLGTFIYTPEADFNGTDSFTFKANDGRIDSNISTVSFTVTPVNDAAVITGQAMGTVGEDAVPNTVSGDLDATDVDNTDDVFQAVANGATTNGYGTYAVNAAGEWTYTLDNGNATVDALNTLETLSDSFTVYSEDGTAKTVEITIDGANDGPVAADDSGSATEAGGIANGTPGSNATDNVLDNDTSASSLQVTGIRIGDIEGSGTAGTLGVALAGAYGTLTMDAAGNYTYVVNEIDPDVQALNVTGANTSLTDTFNYTTSDGSLADTAVLAITINGANDAPTAQPLRLNVKVSESVDGVLLGDDVDGDDDAGSLIYQLVSSPVAGEVSGGFVTTNDSDFTYTAARRGGNQEVTFTYRTVDSHGAASEHTTVTLNITAPTAPTAVDDAFITDEDIQLVGNVLDDNGNGADSDINGDALSVTAGTFATAQGGSVTFQSNGDFTYDPLADFNGQDSFTYEVVDVDGSSTGTVTITVDPVDDLLI